jgi:UDP-N-acetylmuramate dehydrogenase
MILRNISLKKYNTFGLDYNADCFISIKSEDEAISILKGSELLRKPLLVLGGGSNLLFTSDFHGTLIHPEIEGIKILEQKPDYVIVSCGAGVIWDEFVKWVVSQGYGGLENLSLIPGTVGATPVQNIGAYGVEVSDTIDKVRAISLTDGSIKEFNNEECIFGYRNSIFKKKLKGKYFITNVCFRLMTHPLINTAYGSLIEETEKLGSISLYTVRQAVINIRTAKLPDPVQIGNAGSFFKNPVVSESFSDGLRKKYPKIPCYNEPSGDAKIAAGWLIEQCGWKGKKRGDAGVHEKQALVLINYGTASGKDILKLSEEIERSVYEKFGIKLEREVEVI